MQAHFDMCGLKQALKPQWPADDCYHGCCNGESAPTVPAVAASRKAGVSAMAGAAKEAAKEAVKAAEDVADKVHDCSHLASSFLAGHASSGTGGRCVISDAVLSLPYLHGLTRVWQSTGERRDSGRSKGNQGQDHRGARR